MVRLEGLEPPRLWVGNPCRSICREVQALVRLEGLEPPCLWIGNPYRAIR